jgi:RHS repeat-associated protein
VTQIKRSVLVVGLVGLALTTIAFAKTNTSTTVTSSLNPSTYGSNVTFTATVSPSAATGTVTFKDGSTTLGTGTLSNGTTTYSTSTLAVGSHAIKAYYNGDANYNTSISTTLTQTVTKANTTTTVASSLNPSTYGASVTFTATVAPSTATGTVTFKDGSTTLGTGTLSNGSATYSTSTLTVGSHTIKATYGGSGSYNSSTSSALTQTVNKANTTTTVASSLNPATSGQSVTFTATVTPSTATGTVTFKDGSTTLGTGTLSNGTATYSTSTLAVGAHSITASYGGDGNDNSSTSSTLMQTVKASTTTAVASSLNPSTYGATVTFTATVTPSTATGTVTFKDGNATLGTGALSSGTATYATTTLAVGSHSITASYGGDANNGSSSSSALTQTVNNGYLNGYQYRRAIVLSHAQVPNTDQADFPVLISGVYSYLATIANGGLVQNSSGFDIVFSSDPQGGSRLDHEIDTYDPTTGTVNFWVRVPTLSHAVDTIIYLFYGNSNITSSQENKPGVWRNSYAAVWHFGSSTNLSPADSTANANNGTNHGVVVATGKFGGAGSFDGTGNTYLRIPSSNSFKPAVITMEAWVKMTGATTWPDIFSLDYRADGSWNPPYQAYALDFYNNTLEPRLDVSVDSGQVAWNGPNSIATSQWTHVVGTYDGNNMIVYANGSQVVTAAETGPITYGTSQDLDIGTRSPYTTAEAVNGLIDEARISTVARSADWIATEYANQSSPSTFYTVEGQATGTSAPTIQYVSPNAGTTGLVVTIQGEGFDPSQGGSTVTFNGVAATPTSWSDATIVVPVPAGATTGNVVVTVGGVASNGVPFTVGIYSSGYQYRRAIVLSHAQVPNTDQTDFPVLISGVYSYLATVANGGQVQNANGYDIIFSADPEGANKLDHEIDNYNPTTGTASFWVRIPTLSHTADTVIYLFYGNPGISVSQENKPGVWRNNYLSVYHLGNGTSVGLTDSGSAGYNLSGSATAAAGKIGGAASFNGNANTYLYHDSVGTYPNGASPVTVETWFQRASTANYEIVGYGANSANGSREALYWDGSNILLEFESMGLSAPLSYDTNWHHAVGVYTGGTLVTGSGLLYLDGALVSNAASGGTPNITTAEMKIGGIPMYTSCCAMNGSIDEVRISSGIRAADWIATEYANQSSPSTFYTMEGQATANGTPTIQYLSPSSGTPGSTVAIQGFGFLPAPGSSTVTFNGVTAAPVAWNDATILVNVPGGATTGSVVVTVGGVASNAVPFTVLPIPSITSISPTSGSAGTPVTITGNNFGATQGSSTVTFNGVNAAPTTWGASSITVPVPAAAASGNVVVTVGGGQSNGAYFTIPITGISPRSGMVGTYVTISGSGFGFSQGSSTVSLNGTAASVASWSDTSIVAIVPTGATSGPFTVTISGQAELSPSFTVTKLPSGWADADVGTVSQAGSATFSGATFTITAGSSGTGGGGIGGTADGMHFVYQTLRGDGTIIARLTSMQGGQAAVMIRETLNPAAADVNEVYPVGNIYLQDRPSTAASTSLQPPYGAGGYSPPLWFKLVRSGDLFTGYLSSDGVNWNLLGSTPVVMADTVYIGLGVSGFSSTVTATFDSVSISTTTASAPTITGLSPSTASIGEQVSILGTNFGTSQNGGTVLLNGASVAVNSWEETAITFTVPAGATSGAVMVSVAPSQNFTNPAHLEVTGQPLPSYWWNQDVGAVGSQIGNSTFSGGTFTVTGGGTGLNGTADQMQFAYAQLAGDGSIVARVTSITAGQAAIMIRETLNPGSADVSVISNGNIFMQDRPSTGATTSLVNGCCGTSGYPPPVWLKLVRAGNTFTGYVSNDGNTWVSLGTATVSMATDVYIGLAVSGGGSLATGSFDSVSINSSTATAPVISGLSATTASVGSQVEIFGTGFGAGQGASLVFLNGTSVPINLWSSTSIVFTVPTGATTGPLLVSLAPTMNDSNPVHLQITTQPLPGPWLDQDVGAANPAGSATYSGGIFTVTGSGSGFGGTADGMHFVYQSLSGDGSIIARLTAQYNAQAGIMIRETLTPGAADAYVYYYPNQGYLMYRPSTGASSNSQAAFLSMTYPYWLQLVRNGNAFTAYMSSDGVNWTQIGASVTITMAQTVYMGLAVSGTTANFDNVSVTLGTTPFVSGVSPLVGTIGTPVTVTGSNFGSTQGTSTVSFNGTVASSITSWGSSQIVAAVPNGTPVGTGPVKVAVNSVTSPTTSASMFTTLNPVISSLLPPAGPVGGTLVINGSGFGASQNGTVTIKGINAEITNTCTQLPWYACWSDTQIQVWIPPNATSGNVIVTNDGIASNAVPFTVIGAPVVTSISPTVASIGGSVTINGSGFGASQSDSVVAFTRATASNIVSWSDSQIVATVPSGTVSGAVCVSIASVSGCGGDVIIQQVTTVTDSLSHQSTYTSQILSNAWNLVQVQGSGCSSCIPRGNVQYTYDSNGNVASITDGNSHTWNYTYDNYANMLSQSIQVNGQTATTSYTYNNFGEVLTMTDALGNVTTATYDAHGNLLTVTTPAPNPQTPASVTQFAYDAKGELTQIADPLGHPTTLTYYPTGLIQTIADAQNNTTSYAYDQRGNRTSVIDPINGAAHPTTFTYDLMNRLTGINYPDNSSVSFGYDYRGRRTTATDQNNRTTHYGYDDADRLTSVTDPANNLTQYNYDTENNLSSINDANNHTTYFQYDAWGRVTQTTFPSTLYETYGYDGVGNLTSKIDRKNQTIQYVYDALNRLTTKTYPDTTTANFVYDLVGKIKQVTDPTGTYGFAYDNMGRLTGTTTQYSFLPGYNYQNAYAYDAASNRTWLVGPDGSSNQYNYDTLNRLSSLTNSLTGQFEFSYDALTRRTQLTRPNGINTNYSYDSVSHLLSVLHQAGSTTLDGAGYGYDAAGNRTSKTNYLNGITEGYTYDLIYELTQVAQGATTTESYTYDNAGNRLSSSSVPTYNYNSSNELTSSSSGSYTYDNDGNTLTDASGRSFTWDFESRLVQAVVPGTGTTTFKYDPFGRRIQKSGPLGTTNYLYDAEWQNVIEETDGTGTVVARYAQEPSGLDFPLAEFRSSATSYYQQDGLNSVTSLSNTAGTLANTYTYDAFGKRIASSGTLTNPFQYTGREFDLDTGIYEYRARYYDQTLGRFLSEDPTGFSNGTYNLYDYVSGDPVDFNDPSGNKRIHGNWCGPNWTGGQVETYIPSHDQDGYYKDPRDYVDKVCSHHDKCYSKCRAKHPCSRTGRLFCEKKCDLFLIGRVIINPKDIYRLPAYEVGLGIGVYLFVPLPGPNGGVDPAHPVDCGCH